MIRMATTKEITCLDFGKEIDPLIAFVSRLQKRCDHLPEPNLATITLNLPLSSSGKPVPNSERDSIFLLDQIAIDEGSQGQGLLLLHLWLPIEEGSHPQFRLQPCKRDSKDVREAIVVMTAKEALKAVKVDEQWLEDLRRQFPASLSEVEELSVHFKDVMPNEGASGASTSSSGEKPFRIIKAPSVSDFDMARFDEIREITQSEVVPKALSMEATSTVIVDLTDSTLFEEPLNQVPLENFGEDSYDCDGLIMPKKKCASSSDGGVSKKARVKTKEKVLQQAASRRQATNSRSWKGTSSFDDGRPPRRSTRLQRTELPPLPPAPFILLVSSVQLTEVRLEAVDKFYHQRATEYDKQAKIIEDKFINESTMEKKVKLHLELQQKAEAVKTEVMNRALEAENKLAVEAKAREEYQQRITNLEGENSTFMGRLQEKEAQHVKALEQAFVHSVLIGENIDNFAHLASEVPVPTQSTLPEGQTQDALALDDFAQP
uniref:Uncharacterized protein n=1 Tax=Cannabis sativa TaxID=3483 RepID=A0A803Q8A4_CANSA